LDKGDDNKLDKIIMQGMRFYGYHGVLDKEKLMGQEFVVDCEMLTNFKRAAEKDDINLTINYAVIYENVKKIVENEKYDLIETVAERIAQCILDNKRIDEVIIRVKKPQAPISGEFKHMAVEISRRNSV
jgi:dihydroneopterin aldolase